MGAGSVRGGSRGGAGCSGAASSSLLQEAECGEV